MKKIFLLASVIIFAFSACNSDDSPSDLENSNETVTDIDGNVYKTVKIGNQVWMAENLRVTAYPDGTPIPNVTAAADWMALENNNIEGAYCFYDNDANNGNTYGALYTYAAVIAENGTHENNPGQGIAPDGWHVPTQTEIEELENYLAANGFDGNIATALKATSGWNFDSNGTDDFGFAALPSGSRSYVDGNFDDLGNTWNIWTATTITAESPCWAEGVPENPGERACGRHTSYVTTVMIPYDFTKSGGISVRCIKD